LKGHSLGVGDLFLGKTILSNVYHISNLKYKFISISQICDLGFSVLFEAKSVAVRNSDGETVIQGTRSNLIYVIDWGSANSVVCLSAQ